jgi:hypothetical protein
MPERLICFENIEYRTPKLTGGAKTFAINVNAIRRPVQLVVPPPGPCRQSTLSRHATIPIVLSILQG